MTAKHKQDQINSLRRIRLKEILETVHTIPVDPDTSYLDDWERGYARGESVLANKIRAILNNIPKSYNLIEPSLKTQAKNRFIALREQQAKGEWKTLPEAEQERWIAYVENHVPYEKIREEEAGRV